MDLSPWRGYCRSCQARFAWAITSGGERMPVDDQPAANGNVLLLVQAGQLTAGVLSTKDARRRRATGTQLHRAHFATCPDAKQHRRKR